MKEVLLPKNECSGNENGAYKFPYTLIGTTLIGKTFLEDRSKSVNMLNVQKKKSKASDKAKSSKSSSIKYDKQNKRTTIPSGMTDLKSNICNYYRPKKKKKAKFSNQNKNNVLEWKNQDNFSSSMNVNNSDKFYKKKSKRKRKNSDARQENIAFKKKKINSISNDLHILKTKQISGSENVFKTNTDSGKSIPEAKQDDELFFFDIAGRRDKSYIEPLCRQIMLDKVVVGDDPQSSEEIKNNKKNIKRKNLLKKKKHKISVDMKKEVNFNDSFFVQKKRRKKKEIYANKGNKRYVDNHKIIKDSDVSICNVTDIPPTNLISDDFKAFDLESKSGVPEKMKGDSHLVPVQEITVKDSCDENDISDPLVTQSAALKKKKHKEAVSMNCNNFDHKEKKLKNPEISTESSSDLITNFESKRKQKHIERKMLVDIRDSDCEVTSFSELSPKQRERDRSKTPHIIKNMGAEENCHSGAGNLIKNGKNVPENKISITSNEIINTGPNTGWRKDNSQLLNDVKHSDSQIINVNNTTTSKKMRKKYFQNETNKINVEAIAKEDEVESNSAVRKQSSGCEGGSTSLFQNKKKLECNEINWMNMLSLLNKNHETKEVKDTNHDIAIVTEPSSLKKKKKKKHKVQLVQKMNERSKLEDKLNVETTLEENDFESNSTLERQFNDYGIVSSSVPKKKKNKKLRTDWQSLPKEKHKDDKDCKYDSRRETSFMKKKNDVQLGQKTNEVRVLEGKINFEHTCVGKIEVESNGALLKQSSDFEMENSFASRKKRKKKKMLHDEISEILEPDLEYLQKEKHEADVKGSKCEMGGGTDSSLRKKNMHVNLSVKIGIESTPKAKHEILDCSFSDNSLQNINKFSDTSDGTLEMKFNKANSLIEHSYEVPECSISNIVNTSESLSKQEKKKKKKKHKQSEDDTRNINTEDIQKLSLENSIDSSPEKLFKSNDSNTNKVCDNSDSSLKLKKKKNKQQENESVEGCAESTLERKRKRSESDHSLKISSICKNSVNDNRVIETDTVDLTKLAVKENNNSTKNSLIRISDSLFRTKKKHKKKQIEGETTFIHISDDLPDNSLKDLDKCRNNEQGNELSVEISSAENISGYKSKKKKNKKSLESKINVENILNVDCEVSETGTSLNNNTKGMVNDGIEVNFVKNEFDKLYDSEDISKKIVKQKNGDKNVVDIRDNECEMTHLTKGKKKKENKTNTADSEKMNEKTVSEKTPLGTDPFDLLLEKCKLKNYGSTKSNRSKSFDSTIKSTSTILKNIPYCDSDMKPGRNSNCKKVYSSSSEGYKSDSSEIIFPVERQKKRNRNYNVQTDKSNCNSSGSCQLSGCKLTVRGDLIDEKGCLKRHKKKRQSVFDEPHKLNDDMITSQLEGVKLKTEENQTDGTPHGTRKEIDDDTSSNKGRSNNCFDIINIASETDRKVNELLHTENDEDFKGLISYESEEEDCDIKDIASETDRKVNELLHTEDVEDFKGLISYESEEEECNIKGISLSSLANCSKEDTEDDVKRFQSINIMLPFSLPPLHSILTRSTLPSKEQLAEIKKLNIQVKSGPFSKEEDQKILTNWKEFCKEYNFRMIPSMFVNLSRKMPVVEKVNFLRYLAHGLDNRLLHRVHARFKILVQKPDRISGKFTAEEDKTILEYMKKTFSLRPFCDLCELLNRSRLSIEKRYYRLSSENKTTLKWTKEMTSKFITYLRRVTNCENIWDLEHRKISTEEWKKVSQKMDNIPVVKLQRAWQIVIHPRLFAKSNVSVKEIKKEIIEMLYKGKAKDWREINWKEIAKHFPGFTSLKIYMMFRTLADYKVPKEKRGDLQECVRYLHKLVKHNTLSTPHKFEKLIQKDEDVIIKNKRKKSTSPR